MFRAIFIGFLLMLRLTSIASCERPAAMQINALSVDPNTNFVVISWAPLDYNVSGYILYIGRGASHPDTIRDHRQSVDTLEIQATVGVEFRLLAFHRCGDIFAPPGQWSVGEVFSCQIEQRHCERDIRISWDDASQSIRDIAHFEIFASIDGGVFDSAFTVDASQNFTTIPAIGQHGQTLRIFVRAVSSDPTIYANSIADTLTLYLAPIPTFAHIETVTVINDNTVEIRTSVDDSEPWGSIYFFADNSFLRTASYSEFQQNAGRFSLPRLEHAFYHFTVSDTCGIVVKHSDTVAKPIRLAGDLNAKTVIFTDYYGWFGYDIRYYLFEVRDGDTTRYLRQPNLPHVFTILDTELVMSLSYFVVAYKISPTLERIDSTRSNVVTLISRTEIPVYFADAFMPRSAIPENRTFRPFFIPMANDRMRFSIFNTFGQTVFTTTDPYHIGWDGTFNNSDAQPGIYTYHFELTRGDTTTRKRGVVILIR